MSTNIDDMIYAVNQLKLCFIGLGATGRIATSRIRSNARAMRQLNGQLYACRIARWKQRQSKRTGVWR